MHKLFLLFAFSLFLISCDKDNPPTPEPSTPFDPFALIWQTQFASNEELAGTWQPIIDGDMVLYMRIDLSEYCEVIGFNKKNGEKKWEWKSPEPDLFGTPAHLKTIYLKDNVLYFNDKNWTFAINTQTGQTVWQNKYKQRRYSTISGIGNLICRAVKPEVDNRSHEVCVANTADGNWRTVYQKKSLNHTDLHFIQPKLLVYQGDTLVFFGESYFTSQGGNFSREDTVTLVNISKNNRVEWRKPIYATQGASPSRNTEFDNANLYFTGDGVICMSIETGEIKWEYESETTHVQGGIVLKDNHVFALVDTKLVKIDKNTGVVKWTVNNLDTYSNPEYHNNMVYVPGVIDGTSKLVIIDASNGNTVRVEKSPNEAANSSQFFDTVVSVDAQTGRIYLSDYKNALCFEKVK
jgi:outer membrane protein assembly factor BamB